MSSKSESNMTPPPTAQLRITRVCHPYLFGGDIQYHAQVPDLPDRITDSSQPPQSFEVPSALPSVLARVLAFSAIIVASICGGLMGFALGRLQWNETERAWVLLVSVVGSLSASVGVAIVAVLVLRAMAEWSNVASVRVRRK